MDRAAGGARRGARQVPEQERPVSRRGKVWLSLPLLSLDPARLCLVAHAPGRAAQAKADAKAKREQQLLERQAKAQADRDKVRAEKKAKAERAAQPKAAPEDRQQKQPKQPTQSKQAKQTKQAPPKETKTERTERLCQQMFDKFDKDGDGYHNFKETQAVVKALQGVGDHVDTDVDEAEYKHFCTDLGADPKRGVNLRQFTTVYTDKSFGANFDLDYKHVFGVDPEEQRKADERKAKSERARQEAEAEVEAERKAKVKREKAREERDPKAKADREAAAKVRAEKKAAYEAKATAEADAKAKAEAEDIAKMAAAKESALKELGLPRTPANSMPLPSDAIILRRFYTHHAVGKASAEEWGAQSWSHAQWAEKIGRIIGSYRRKVTKRAENKGIAVTEDDCRQAMFADYIKLKGVDLPAWVGTWEQLGITPSTSTRYKAMTPHRHTAPESTPMADDNVSVHSDRSAVDPEVLAAAKAKAAEDARQRRLAFLESKAASVSVSGTTRSGKTIERVSDWVHTSPVPRGMDQSHGLEVFTADDFETGELMEDFQAASEEAEVQRQGELAHRQLIGTRAAFARADTDGDGVVSAEELLEWFAAEMAVTNIEASDDQQDWLKPWQKRIGATIMEAPAIGSSGNVGVAVEGFSKLRARRLKELNEELQEAREGFEVVRRKHLTLQERTARARALSGITKQRSPTKNGGASPPMRPRGAVRSVDASSSADAVHRVISELTRLRIGIATLDEQNTSMQETLQVIEQLSPSSTRVGAQELEPEPELVSESVAEDPDKPQSKMLPAQIHMMAHCELMVAEHLLNPAGAYSLKGHLREHSLKVANMLRRWQPIPTALAVASTAVLHMDLHYKQCLSENAHAPPTSSAAHELKELCDAHAVRIAEAARGRPKAATAIVVRFTEPGPIGVALSSEHPFDAAWKQADVNGDGQLSRREVVHLLRVMGRLDDHSKASVVEQYTTQVLHELDPTGKGVIGAEEFQRWHEAQPRQEMARVRVESCGLVAARQGLQEGFYLLAVNDVDVRDKSIRDITSFIRSAGRPLTMEFGFAEGAPAVSQKPPIQSPPDAMTSSSFDSEILLMTLKGDVNDIKASGEETSFRASFQQQLGSVVGLAEVSRIQIKSLLAPGLTVKFSFSPSASGAPAATLMKKLALMASDGSLAAAIPDYVPGSFKAAVPAVKMELVPAPVPPKPALRTMTLIFGKDEDLGLVLGRHDPLDKNWYVESVSDYAASRGIRVGAKLVSVQGTDVRETPLHEVMEVIKVAREGVKSGKAMKMVIERLDDSHVPTRAPAAPASLLTVTLKKDKKQKDMSHGSYGMVLTPKLRVESLPPSSSGKKRKPGPAEKAGVKVGYILVSINGTKVTSIADVGAIFSKAGKLAIDCTFEQVGPAPARSASPSTSLPAGAELEYSNSAHCTVHIGGLGTYLPQPDETLAEATKEQCEAELRQHFERFGEILTCNARLRHKMEDVDGVPTLKESWALISYHLSSEALAAVQGVTALNTPHWPNLVARMVDTNQVQSSTGGMAQVMTEKHEEEERALVSKLKAMLSPRSRAKLENEQGDKKVSERSRVQLVSVVSCIMHTAPTRVRCVVLATLYLRRDDHLLANGGSWC